MTAHKSESNEIPLSPEWDSQSVNIKLFAIEVTEWGEGVAFCLVHSLLTVTQQAFQGIEKSKKAVLKPLLPRNSAIGRPYSPLSIGSLSAVIGMGGLIFGHNGLVIEKAIAGTNITPANQQVSYASVIANGLMVDNSQVQTVIPAGRLRDSVITIKVKDGDTLEGIAQQYNVTVDSLQYVNNLGTNDSIKPGQQLSILPVSGILHEVKPGDTLQSIADKWKVPAQAIVDVNWLDEPYQVTVGEKLVIPNAEIPKPTPTKSQSVSSSFSLSPSSPNKSTKGSGIFSWPAPGQITQYFSYYHNGIDIGDYGATPPISAADGGVVTFAGWWNGGGGNSVWIDHGNGYVTQYAHMSRIVVSVGQSVSRGQQVGVMGNTGMSFGNHLMFNVLLNGRAIDPLTVL